MADCIFCGIASGDIPSERIAETDQVVAFRDIAPVAPTHVLVIPRRHVSNASELQSTDGELLAQMFDMANQIAVSDSVGESGYRLVFNVGEDAGNTVPHLHLHVIGGRKLSWPPG